METALWQTSVSRHVVISQTHWLVSRVRLPQWRESLALLNVQCCHLVSGASGSNISRLVCHTTLLPHQGARLLLAFATNFKYSKYFCIKLIYIYYTINRCIISKFCYFAGNYPASLPPRG